MRRTLGVVTLWGVIVVTAAPAAERVDLRPHFKSGQKRYVEITEATEQKISGAMFGDQPMVTRNSTVYGFVEEVVRAAKDATQIRLTFDRRGLSLEHPMAGSAAFDTDTGGDDQGEQMVAPVMRPWLGQSVVLTIGPDVKVTDVQGLDGLRAALEKSASGNMLYEQTKESLTKDNIGSRLFEARYSVLPNREVAVGEEWTETIRTEAPPLGTLVSKYTCRLEKVEQRGDRKVAVIGYTVKTTVDKSTAPPAQPGQPQPELKEMTSTGTLLVDVASGLPIEQTSTSKARIELTAQGPPGGEGKMVIHVDNDSKFRVRTMSVQERAKARAAKATPAATPTSDKPVKPQKP